jgi:hypothetical protein
MTMSETMMQAQLGRHATKCILHALAREEQRLNQIGMTSSDEDQVADAANDLMGLRGVIDFLQKNAVGTFGESILNFGNAPL